MKNVILFSAIALIFTSIFFSSCKKETIERTIQYKDSIVYVKDTIKVFSHDTVTIIKGLDSVKVYYNYTISYTADSIGSAVLHASDNSKNVPTNATYTWRLNGDAMVVQNQTFCNASFDKRLNGTYTLSMSINCPDIKRIYTVVKVFTIKLKG